MNTTDKPTVWMEKTGTRLGGVGTLIKGVSILIGSIGLLLIALHEFPDWVPPPTHPDQTEQPKSPVIPSTKDPAQEDNRIIPVDNLETGTKASGVLDVGGAWHDDQNAPVDIRQDGSVIRFSMESISDGTTCQLIGSGTMVDQTVELNLDCRAYNMSLGIIPAKLTFVNTKKAIVSFTFMGVPISSELHR